MLVTYKDKIDAAHQLFEEIRVVLENPDSPAEEKARVMDKVEAAKLLQAEAMALKATVTAGLDLLNAKKADLAGGMVVPDASKFGHWGEFLVKVWEAGHPNIKTPPDPRLSFMKDDSPKSIDTKDLSGQTGASGGFLIPAEFQAQLYAIVGERSIVRGGASIIPMRRRQIDIPVLDQTGTTSGLPHWFGGMRFYWAEEASQKTETDATFRQMTLVAHKLIGYTRASDELVDDSAISLEAFFSGPLGFAGGVAWMEDYAFLRGTGTGQPLGIINANATIVQPRVNPGQITILDITRMLEQFLPSGRGSWMITQSAMSEMLQMAGPVGSLAPYYVWINGARDGAPSTLFGYPVTWTEKLPRIGGQGDILLADLSYYLIGDRQATTVESTKFDRWQYDQTSWRVVHRVDGQPWLSDPLTLQDGTSQVSPFVILGSASLGS